MKSKTAPALALVFSFPYLSPEQEKEIDFAALLPPIPVVEPEDALETFEIEPGFRSNLSPPNP